MYNDSFSQKISKINFKGNVIPDTFVSEQEIINKIKTMPRKTLEEREAFIKYCKSIKITPQISAAINERLANIEKEAKIESVAYIEAIDKATNACKKLIEGYKKLLESSGQLFDDEIAQIRDIISRKYLPENIRIEAESLLKRIPKK